MARVPEHVRKAQSQDGAVLLDVRHGRMFTLNLVGSKILGLLDQQHTTTQIAQELNREFGISTDLAMRDVAEFVAALEKHQLIDARRPDTTL